VQIILCTKYSLIIQQTLLTFTDCFKQFFKTYQYYSHYQKIISFHHRIRSTIFFTISHQTITEKIKTANELENNCFPFIMATNV
jgi:hypothetical protein